MVTYQIIAEEIGSQISFRTRDGYQARGTIAHVRFSCGLRGRVSVLYGVTRAEGHPLIRCFWVKHENGEFVGVAQ